MTQFLRRPVLGLVFCLSLTAASAQAATTTIAQWTFETSVPASAGSFAAEVGSGSALGFHAGASTYSSPVGNGSAHSFSSNTWAVGDYYQFQVSTAGYDSIALTWDQTSSNTGPRNFKLAYSTNGTTFTDFASYSVLANAAPNATWASTGTPKSIYNLTDNLGAIPALNNQAAAYFRLVDVSTVSANGLVVASGGTDRVDNFTVTGSVIASVPEPESYAMMLAGLGLMGVVARRSSK
jgi:hypothetical protein